MKELANYFILISMLVLAGSVSSSQTLIDNISPLSEEILSKVAIGFLVCILLLVVVNYQPKNNSSSE